MSNNTYWNSTGKHQAAYQELCKLVPSSGPAGTIEGEMLRAATRLYHDYYNNGMINNTSGAVNYLIRCDELFDLELCEELEIVASECNTGHYTDKSLAYSLEVITDAVIEYLISKNGLYTESGDNMLDYDEPDVTFEDPDYTEEDMWEEEYEWVRDDVLADIEYDELNFKD